MDKKIEIVVAALALIGGVLVASGLMAHAAFIVRAGIPMDKQAFVGGGLALIAVALHCVMGGRLLP
ncbi:hypothetical protein [Paraburkholderia caledonica]|uniref:hypothetical protein n=1 Tax=Paraburkholderia caledonica TaxID=134536 RepID=UPI000B491343|nr:hypothetical protein BWU74_32745 [Burkholderia sp. Bk]